MHTVRQILPKTLLLLTFALFFAPVLASAATLYISPEADSYATGRNFSVRVRVNTTQSINAVSGTVTFPTDKLQVTSVSKVGSILTLWVQEPSFSNSGGSINFEGVVPNPGYTGQGGQVIVVNFRVVGAGSATLNFTGASVLANDGNGTNVLDRTGGATYSLGAVTTETPVITPVTPPSTSGTPTAPTVISPTHPIPSKWYKSHDGLFNWNVGNDVISNRTLFNKSGNSTPTEVHTPAITTKEIKNIDEGIWYLHIQNKNALGWGGVTHFAVRVDSTDPEVFTMKEIVRGDPTEPRIKLSLNATDNFSGIKSFGIQVDNEEMVEWVDDSTGIYTTPPLTPGPHTIFARAYDEAGNFATASTNVKVDPINAPVITSYTAKVSESSPLIVRGTTLPFATIEIHLVKSGDKTLALKQDVVADETGAFVLAVDTGKLSGAYDLSAIAKDKRGAQSLPSEPKQVLINASFFVTLGNLIIKSLTFAIPALALLFVLAVVLMRGFHHVRMTNAKFRKELHNIEHLVDRAFILLKEEVEDSIRLLERTKNKRRLTDEEDALIERLRQNLREAEKVIHNEVRKVEKELE